MDTALAIPRGSQDLTQDDPRWRRAIPLWLGEIRASGSEVTAQLYARYLEHFLGDFPNPSQATDGDIVAFIQSPAPGRAWRAPGPGWQKRDQPSETPPSRSTMAARLTALKSFYAFARRQNLVTENPTLEVHAPSTKQTTARPPRSLNAGEIRALLAAIPNSPAGRRDRAIIVTITLTALRRAEVLGLRSENLTVDADSTAYYTTRVKGGGTRHRELPPPAWKAIQDFLERQNRPWKSLVPAAPLFPGKAARDGSPRPLNEKTFAENLARYAKKAGLAHVHPHALRHSAAQLRRREGHATLEEVQSLLGHSLISTTARYLRRIEGEKDSGWTEAAAAIGLTSD